jgi:hypothetical protein
MLRNCYKHLKPGLSLRHGLLQRDRTSFLSVEYLIAYSTITLKRNRESDVKRQLRNC